MAGIPVVTDGVGLETFGLTWNPSIYAVSGLGLETFGFIFLNGDIWVPTNLAPATIWTKCTDDDE